MALKPLRIQNGKETLINKKCAVVAERGLIAIAHTTDTFVSVSGTLASGHLPAGMILDDVVDFDLTTRPANLHKNEIEVSGLVSLALEGQFLVDTIPDGVSPAQFEDAFLVASGLTSNVAAGVGELELKVGKWLTGKDADGFALLDLEMNN